MPAESMEEQVTADQFWHIPGKMSQWAVCSYVSKYSWSEEMEHQHLITTVNTTKPQREGTKPSLPPRWQILIYRKAYASKRNVLENIPVASELGHSLDEWVP